MNALPWILAAWAIVLTLLAAYGLWRIVLHVQHLSNELRVAIAAFGRPIHQPMSTDFTRIKETPPIKGAAGLEFYRGLHQSTYWGPLAHKFQTDARELLLQARSFHADGKADAGTFVSGAAFYASQQAVMVEREIATLASNLQRESEDKKLNELAGLEDSPRPARY